MDDPDVEVLAAPDDVGSGVGPADADVALQNAMTRLAELVAADLAPVRHAVEGRLNDGQHPVETDSALRELVLLLGEIETA